MSPEIRNVIKVRSFRKLSDLLSLISQKVLCQESQIILTSVEFSGKSGKSGKSEKSEKSESESKKSGKSE